MKLYFEDRYSRLREIAEVQTKEEVSSAIKNFLDQFNYKSYYTRYWVSEEHSRIFIVYDVGSHSEFFKLEFDSIESARNFLQSQVKNL